jgi:hypothetical protein
VQAEMKNPARDGAGMGAQCMPVGVRAMNEMKCEKNEKRKRKNHLTDVRFFHKMTDCSVM